MRQYCSREFEKYRCWERTARTPQRACRIDRGANRRKRSQQANNKLNCLTGGAQRGQPSHHRSRTETQRYGQRNRIKDCRNSQTKKWSWKANCRNRRNEKVINAVDGFQTGFRATKSTAEIQPRVPQGSHDSENHSTDEYWKIEDLNLVKWIEKANGGIRVEDKQPQSRPRRQQLQWNDWRKDPRIEVPALCASAAARAADGQATHRLIEARQDSQRQNNSAPQRTITDAQGGRDRLTAGPHDPSHAPRIVRANGATWPNRLRKRPCSTLHKRKQAALERGKQITDKRDEQTEGISIHDRTYAEASAKGLDQIATAVHDVDQLRHDGQFDAELGQVGFAVLPGGSSKDLHARCDNFSMRTGYLHPPTKPRQRRFR